jgi:hypothetical protein
MPYSLALLDKQNKHIVLSHARIQTHTNTLGNTSYRESHGLGDLKLLNLESVRIQMRIQKTNMQNTHSVTFFA